MTAEIVRAAAAVLGGFAVGWLVLVAVLWRSRPDEHRLRDALRLLPDVLRLLHRLVRDPAVPRGVRVRVALTLAYLACPVDLVPDVVPVVGFADDLVVVVLTLRSVVRQAGPDAVARHWPGTAEGLATLNRLCGLGAAG